ncbi:MAG: hypothetical protein RR733_02760 [Victivallaceae bacterium]
MVFMKRLFLLPFLGLLLFSGTEIEAKLTRHSFSQSCAGNLESVTGAPSEELLHLLSLTGIKHSKSWEGIVQATSVWRISEQDKSEGLKASSIPVSDLQAFYNDMSLLGMTQLEAPYAANYDYAVIPGAILSVMRQRLRFLINEWERGVRVDHIIFVTRDRPLYKGSEDPEKFVNPKYNQHPIKEGWDQTQDVFKIQNENDIAPFIWGQMKLPKEWTDGTVKVSFITVDDCKNPDSRCKYEAFKHWLHNEHPGEKSKVLFVSSQPFVRLDDCRILKTFRNDKKVEYDVAGPGFALFTLEQPWGVRVCLDVLASWISESKSKGKIASFF